MGARFDEQPAPDPETSPTPATGTERAPRALSMIPLPPGQSPRTWQLEAWAAINAGLKRWDNILVSAATGTGKGTLIAGLCAKLARRGVRVLFLVHRDELIQDVAGRLRLLEVEPGIVCKGEKVLDRPVTLASVASCKPKMLAELLSFGHVPYCVTDEAHHAASPSYRRVYKALRASGAMQSIGLTATPFRAGPEGSTSGLGGVFDALVYEYPLARAIADGVLVPIEGLRITTETPIAADLDDEAAIDAAVNVAPRNALIVEKYLEHAPHKPALGFATSIAHAQAMADLFVAAGVKAAAIWGADPERGPKLDAYRAGQLDVLWCRDLLTEGVDLPRTEALLLTRPTGSPVLYAQMIGRGTRLHPGKTCCLALDFVDVLEHGAVMTLPNMLDSGEAKPSTQLKPGTRVAHRHDPSRADGNLVAIEDGVIRIARVAWVGWGKLDPVPLHDIRRVRLELDDVAVEEVLVAPAVGSVAEFRVLLLNGSTLPWYRYSGSKGDVRYTLSAPLQGSQSGPRRVAQLVREGAGLWSAWLAGEDWPMREGTLPDCVAMISEWLEHAGLRPMNWALPWTREAITERQIQGLRKWGIQRPLNSLCRGEASILLDTKIAKARIDGARKRRKVAA